MLTKLASKNREQNLLFVGIELDSTLHEQSCTLLSKEDSNIVFINGNFEEIVAAYKNETIGMFISILPHPNYIGQEREDRWRSFYKMMLNKLKKNGKFLLITEYTNELLSPVTIEEFEKWKEWIALTFEQIGFNVDVVADNPPLAITSHYLTQFKNDKDRIKILTLLMGK
jgi:tRNA G46 methylase TrmB